MLTLGVVGGWAFLTLLPRRGGWFTRMGAFTLVVYLLHGFAVLGAEYAGLPGWAERTPVAAFVLVSARRRGSRPAPGLAAARLAGCSTSSTRSAWRSARSARPST